MMEHGIRMCEWVQIERRWGLGVSKVQRYDIFSLSQAKVTSEA